ncbi:MAG: tRNA (adenosine(37)-N6)-dimethylallyltransferase MiaA [Rickettsiales bacterium]|jgi:tRNA dimethylallyltransferase|nr:tRNA (adenosine(37)-N6)-dimethylallyltransferase MiaA [Rickettsiales bacterium]
MKHNKIIIITGPTASGKTSFAVKLAREIDGEIINADSLQVYKENPIISAQPTELEKQNIPHHLFGYVMGDEEYNVARWIKDACECIKSLKKTPIIVGGTGLYLKHLIFGLSSIPNIPDETRSQAMELLNKLGNDNFHKALSELDPEAAAKINPNNVKRSLRSYEVIKFTGKSILQWQKENISYFPISSFKVKILEPNREDLYKKCNQRFLNMLELGVIEEVRYLMAQNYNPICGIMKSHGVPELSKYLLKEWSLEEAIAKSQQVTRNYAKRQTTWFKHQFKHPELDVEFIKP